MAALSCQDVCSVGKGALLAEADNLSWIPQLYGGRREQTPKSQSDLYMVNAHVCANTHIHTIYLAKPQATKG